MPLTEVAMGARNTEIAGSVSCCRKKTSVLERIISPFGGGILCSHRKSGGDLGLKACLSGRSPSHDRVLHCTKVLDWVSNSEKGTNLMVVSSHRTVANASYLKQEVKNLKLENDMMYQLAATLQFPTPARICVHRAPNFRLHLDAADWEAPRTGTYRRAEPQFECH